jgi:hypothetical protein
MNGYEFIEGRFKKKILRRIYSFINKVSTENLEKSRGK